MRLQFDLTLNATLCFPGLLDVTRVCAITPYVIGQRNTSQRYNHPIASSK